MAFLLFVDESGQDHGASPYEVLAGIAVHDTQLWNLIRALNDAEKQYFGSRVTLGSRELKASKLLKRKTFRLAGQKAAIEDSLRLPLAEAALLAGDRVSGDQLTALAQAKIAYCSRALDLCAEHNVRVFASIVKQHAPRPTGDMLRKDYAYMFERFFYFVDQQQEAERGLVVFDELERSRAHVLSEQMSAYFAGTATGRRRAGRIIPEPFFVHSDLTTGVQMADMIAYLISWNVRVSDMDQARRVELDALGAKVLDLRHRAVLPRTGFPNGFVVWSLALLDDLRPRSEIEFERDFAEAFDRELGRLTREQSGRTDE